MGTTPHQVKPLDEDRIDHAVRVFTRAFRDEPLFIYGWPDPTVRERLMPLVCRWNLRHGQRFGLVLAPAGGVDGIAIAYPPGDEVFTADRMTESGYDDMRDGVGAATWNRIQGAFDAADAALHAAVPEPCWYLDAVAVAPARQGAGVGSALVRAVHDRADADGAPTVLVTFLAKNVAWYERRGYEVVCADPAPTTGVPWWGCRRRPGA